MSAFTLIIGNKNYSSWSLRAWLWMKHLGIEFDEVVIPLYSDDTDAQLGVYFSGCKVPVLIHDGLEIWDSLAICEYLAELYPQKGLLSDARQRGVMRSLSAEMHSSFVGLRSELPMNCRRQPGSLILSDVCLADIDRIRALWQHAAEFSDDKGDFLFGSFSMADAMFAPVVLRFHRYNIALTGRSQSYMNAMLKHPAMQEWVDAGRAESEVIEGEER